MPKTDVTQLKNLMSQFTTHGKVLSFELSRKTARKKDPFILLVEDNPADIELMTQAFHESEFGYHLHVARDGVECLRFLRKTGPYSKARTPDMIILDLNLPKKGGRAVLAEVKQDNALKRIPIVILSTSDAEEDILMSYELHANSYITKPVDLEEFVSVVGTLKQFWLQAAKLPKDWGTTH